MMYTVTQEHLERLVSDFELNPVSMRRSIQDCYAQSPEKFLHHSLGLLAKPGGSKAEGYLLSLLMQNEKLAVRLGDPELCTKEEAVQIARRANKIDPTFDRQIANLLMGGLRLADEEISRLLAILESISPPANLLPLLNVLVQHSNPRIRSKATLLLGRSKRSVDWVMSQLTEPDGRVRANAVESLWGMDGPDVIEAFLAAVQDPVARVAANGALGLYRARQTRSLELLMSFGQSQIYQLRRSACWAMGQTQDPRFLRLLAKLVRDPEPTVRSNALRAATAIRTHLNILKQEPIKVFLSQTTLLDSGVRVACLNLRRSGGAAIPSLHALSFTLEESDTSVTRYEVEHIGAEESVALGFVAPKDSEVTANYRDALREAFRTSLEWKPQTEMWATACYSNAFELETDRPPLVQTAADQVEKGFEIAQRSFQSGMLAAIEAVYHVLPAGQRAIVVVGNETAESTSIVFQRDRHIDVFLTALQSQGVAIHGILLPGCTPLFTAALQLLTRETGGTLYRVAGEGELAEAVIEALASAHCEYRIRYWGFEDIKAFGPLRVVVKTQTGYGETIRQRPAFPLD
ncbi:MAG: HEAT repeat domain-containing protein [Bryobacteraceae bacterium]